MDDSPVEEYRNKMTDWGLPLSQYSQQCQACFAPQSGSGLDIVENTEQGRQANQCRYPRPERRYSVFRNQGTVAPEYSVHIVKWSRALDCFYRMDKSYSKETGGTGFGLSIVKLAVMLHGGKVEPNSIFGEGTTVKVVFSE